MPYGSVTGHGAGADLRGCHDAGAGNRVVGAVKDCPDVRVLGPVRVLERFAQVHKSVGGPSGGGVALGQWVAREGTCRSSGPLYLCAGLFLNSGVK